MHSIHSPPDALCHRTERIGSCGASLFLVTTMASDIRTSDLKDPVDVADYLFRRLYEVGVRGVHGVPGDYNLAALDYLEKAGLSWVGNVNELNAGTFS